MKNDEKMDAEIKQDDMEPEQVVSSQGLATDAGSEHEESSETESVAGDVTKPKSKRNVIGWLFNVILLSVVCFLGYGLYVQDQMLDKVYLQQNELVLDGRNAEVDVSGLQTQAQAQILETQLQETANRLDSQMLSATNRLDSQLLETTNRIDNQLQDATSRITSQNAQLAEASKLVALQGIELERISRELVSARLRISENDNGPNQVWLLAEAESLLRLAQQELIITGDVRAAIALFVASDETLKQIKDPAIFSIREILADDLSLLYEVVEVDTQGVYRELGQINERIAKLQVMSEEQVRRNSANSNIALLPEIIEVEASIFANIMEKISEYFVVRRRDEAIQPLLSPEQQIYLKQNIQLQIQQARFALLNKQDTIFKTSIADAIKFIEQYLTGSDFEKQSIILALEKFSAIDVEANVPNASNTLKALQSLLEANNERASSSDDQVLAPAADVEILE